MKSKCSIFLLVITAICFVLSALEVNTEYINNTFGDKYDSYVQPDNPTHYSVIKVVKDASLDYFIITDSYTSGITSTDNLLLSLSFSASIPIGCKKYLLNRSLLI